jgi:hypothetical protein
LQAHRSDSSQVPQNLTRTAPLSHHASPTPLDAGAPRQASSPNRSNSSGRWVFGPEFAI